MPSPPLVPDLQPIDLAHLARMTLGDPVLEREVLALFTAQAASLVAMLASLPDDAARLAHMLKGSARAIGAFGVAEAAEAFEDALAAGDDAAAALPAIGFAVDAAHQAIRARLRCD